MPKLNHKNVVRYYSCWIEAVEPHIPSINKALRHIQGKKNLHRKELLDDSSMESLCETTVKVVEDDPLMEDSSPDKTLKEEED
jgi:hypothetical protein